MNSQLNQTIPATELIRVVRKKWWLLILCLLLFLTLILIYNHKAVPIYLASTKVIFDDVEKMLDDKRNSRLNVETFFANLMEEMKTESFAAEVFSSLPNHMQQRFLPDSSFSKQVDSLQYAVNRIGGNISMDLIKGTEIIRINFEAREPQLAQVVANTTADALIRTDLNKRNMIWNKHIKFLEEQLETVTKHLHQTEDNLDVLKDRHNITTWEAESREVLKTRADVENLYNESTSKEKELQEKFTAIKSRLDAATETAALSENMNENVSLIRNLQERLAAHKSEDSKLELENVPMYHPRRQWLKNAVEQTELEIDGEIKKLSDSGFRGIIDPMLQISNYFEESLNLKVELQATQSKKKYLASLIDRYSKRLKALGGLQNPITRLVREIDRLKQRYVTLTGEIERARSFVLREVPRLSIQKSAGLPKAPVRPRKLLNIFVGLFSSLLFGSLIIFSAEYFNDSIKTEDHVEESINLPVIVSIPKLKYKFSALLNSNGNGKLTKNPKNASILFDEYNLLYSALMLKKQKPGTIMVTSSIPNEGKSTISMMLAFTSAQRGERTLLVDADLRKPVLHTFFNVPRRPGLTDMAVDVIRVFKKYSEDMAINDTSLGLTNNQIRGTILDRILPTTEDNLFLLPAGFIPMNPVKAWSSKVWNQIFHQLKDIADLIIIDAPPIIGIPDANIMSSYVDHILFCVAANSIDKRTLKRSFTTFQNAVKNSDEKMIGAILNKIDLVSHYSKYNYYKYYSKNLT